MLSLSIRKLCTLSPSSYWVYTLQHKFKIVEFSREIIFFILSLSTHFPVFTLHTVSYLVYTLQAHLRFKIFTGNTFFHTYTLYTCFSIHSPYSYLVYNLQAHVRFKFFKFSREFFFSYLHSPNMFQCSLSIQLFGLHSPSTC